MIKKKRQLSTKNRIKKIITIISVVSGIIFFMYPLATSFFRGVKVWSYKVVCHALSHESVSFELENIYAPNLRHEIINFLSQQTTNVNLLSFCSDDFYINIKKKFDI